MSHLGLDPSSAELSLCPFGLTYDSLWSQEVCCISLEAFPAATNHSGSGGWEVSSKEQALFPNAGQPESSGGIGPSATRWRCSTLVLRSSVDAAGCWSRPTEALGSVLWSRQLAPSHDAILVWKEAKEIPTPATKYAGRSPVPCYPSSQSPLTPPPEASLGVAA